MPFRSHKLFEKRQMPLKRLGDLMSKKIFPSNDKNIARKKLANIKKTARL